MIPQAYNKVADRLLGAPVLAASLDWVGFLDGRMNEIGGDTSGLRKTNPQKGAEPHKFYIFKAKSRRVAFQCKTRHDLVMNSGWQGGDDGIALFAPDQPEPDLRKERPALSGFGDKYMAAGKDGKTTKAGKGRTLPGELIAHLRQEGRYSSDVIAEWERWFKHAWPHSAAEHELFLASLKDRSRAEDGDLYAIQPAPVPPKVAGMHIYIYNLYQDAKRDLKGQWAPAVLIRPTHRGEKNIRKAGGERSWFPSAGGCAATLTERSSRLGWEKRFSKPK